MLDGAAERQLRGHGRRARPKRAELTRGRCSLCRRTADSGDRLFRAWGELGPRQIVERRENDHQRVVVVVRHAARQPSQDLELGRLVEGSLAQQKVIADLLFFTLLGGQTFQRSRSFLKKPLTAPEQV